MGLPDDYAARESRTSRLLTTVVLSPSFPPPFLIQAHSPKGGFRSIRARLFPFFAACG